MSTVTSVAPREDQKLKRIHPQSSSGDRASKMARQGEMSSKDLERFPVSENLWRRLDILSTPASPLSNKLGDSGAVKDRLKEISGMIEKFVNDVTGIYSPLLCARLMPSSIAPLYILADRYEDGYLTRKDHGPFVSLVCDMLRIPVTDRLEDSFREMNNQLPRTSFESMLISIVAFWLYEHVFSKLYQNSTFNLKELQTKLVPWVVDNNSLLKLFNFLEHPVHGRLGVSDRIIERATSQFIDVLTPYVALIRSDGPLSNDGWGSHCEGIVQSSIRLAEDMERQQDCHFSFFLPSIGEEMDLQFHCPDRFTHATASVPETKYVAFTKMPGVTVHILRTGHEKAVVCAEAVVHVQKTQPILLPQSLPSDIYSPHLSPEYSPLSVNSEERMQFVPESEDRDHEAAGSPVNNSSSTISRVHGTRIVVPKLPDREEEILEIFLTNSTISCPFKPKANEKCSTLFIRPCNTLFAQIYKHMRQTHPDDFINGRPVKDTFGNMIRQSILSGRITIDDVKVSPKTIKSKSSFGNKKQKPGSFGTAQHLHDSESKNRIDENEELHQIESVTVRNDNTPVIHCASAEVENKTPPPSTSRIDQDQIIEEEFESPNESTLSAVAAVQSVWT